MGKTPVKQFPSIRVPSNWNQQERMLIVQLTDFFTDINTQIGALRKAIEELTERVEELEE